MTALLSLARLVRRAICAVANHRWRWIETGALPYLYCERCEREMRGGA